MLVVGDVMLDRFIVGRVTRISPEAPVPIVQFESEHVRLGGAANVAHNIASLGGRATLVGRRPGGQGTPHADAADLPTHRIPEVQRFFHTIGYSGDDGSPQLVVTQRVVVDNR